MVPCLIIVSIAVSIWGGYIAGLFSHILTRQQFFLGLTTGFLPYNLFFAMIKAFTFSLIISIIPSYYGYYVEGGALEIGRATLSRVNSTSTEATLWPKAPQDGRSAMIWRRFPRSGTGA
jgi:phospholipid/cholesterol/gamma-HCH transport system permease protein